MENKWLDVNKANPASSKMAILSVGVDSDSLPDIKKVPKIAYNKMYDHVLGWVYFFVDDAKKFLDEYFPDLDCAIIYVSNQDEVNRIVKIAEGI